MTHGTVIFRTLTSVRESKQPEKPDVAATEILDKEVEPLRPGSTTKKPTPRSSPEEEKRGFSCTGLAVRSSYHHAAYMSSQK